MTVDDDIQEVEFPEYMTTQDIRSKVDELAKDMPG